MSQQDKSKKSTCPHGKNLTKEFCPDCGKGKLPVTLVRENLFVVSKIKHREIKHSLDKKIFYPWD